jgi:hypothetical protein
MRSRASNRVTKEQKKPTTACGTIPNMTHVGRRQAIGWYRVMLTVPSSQAPAYQGGHGEIWGATQKGVSEQRAAEVRPYHVEATV